MNVKEDVLTWPKRYTPIPKPYYVVALDDHCQVCILDDNYNLIKEVSAIHWNKYTVRRWAFELAKENKNE